MKNKNLLVWVRWQKILLVEKVEALLFRRVLQRKCSIFILVICSVIPFDGLFPSHSQSNNI